MIHSFSVHDVSQSLSEVIIGSGAARALPGMPLRETRAKLAGEKKKSTQKETEGEREEKRLPFFLQTMQLFSGTSPLADDEGRADVISDKFLIAFQPGPGLTSVSLPFHSSDTVHREESKEHVEISLHPSSLIVCSSCGQFDFSRCDECSSRFSQFHATVFLSSFVIDVYD